MRDCTEMQNRHSLCHSQRRISRRSAVATVEMGMMDSVNGVSWQRCPSDRAFCIFEGFSPLVSPVLLPAHRMSHQHITCCSASPVFFFFSRKKKTEEERPACGPSPATRMRLRFPSLDRPGMEVAPAWKWNVAFWDLVCVRVLPGISCVRDKTGAHICKAKESKGKGKKVKVEQ